MARRIDIKEEVYGRSGRKKEQEKIRYNRGFKMQYFTLGNLVLLKDSTPYFGKLTERWGELFIIDNFGGDHGASYVPKTLNKKQALNINHGDHLYIFYPQEKYLRPADEKPLVVTHNLCFRKKKD